MKYIKTFEKKISLKEYVVINHEYTYMILRINEISKDTVSYTPLYIFNKLNNNGAFILKGTDSKYYGEQLNDIIVFQSNNLSECIEILPALNKMKKYNL